MVNIEFMIKAIDNELKQYYKSIGEPIYCFLKDNNDYIYTQSVIPSELSDCFEDGKIVLKSGCCNSDYGLEKIKKVANYYRNLIRK